MTFAQLALYFDKEERGISYDDAKTSITDYWQTLSEQTGKPVEQLKQEAEEKAKEVRQPELERYWLKLSKETGKTTEQLKQEAVEAHLKKQLGLQ